MRETGPTVMTRRALLKSLPGILLLGLASRPGGLLCTARGAGAASGELTFFVVSDTHYGLTARGDETIPKLVDLMNTLPGTPYPEKIGGKVGTPKGVLHIGDVTDNGKAEHWAKFVKDYGLTGQDGRLKYPVYETFGNHDGNASQPVRKGIRERNPKRVGLTAISENGLHYSWDWDGIHFACLGISPGTRKNPYDPEDSTAFLVQDLAKHVGKSGRPVIVKHHFGFDKEHSWGWWPQEYKDGYRKALEGFNVLAILHGHAHKPFIYQWEGYDIYHPPHFRQEKPKENGPVSHGIFVFRITADELTVAERKLDGTWGMTGRKPLKAAAAAPAK